jgi:SAM-dependent methyltransferase
MEALESHLTRQIEQSHAFFWHRVRWRAVSAYLPAGRAFDLIDIGAGAGFLGVFLARDRPNGRYRFVEPIDSLEHQLELRFGTAANGRAFRDYAGIDYVTLLDVLEHQEDDDAFLGDLAARMEPGSTLILTVPAMQSLWSGWDVALGHYRRYDKRRLRSCVRHLPFAELEISYLFPELVPLAMVRKLRRAPAGESADASFPDLPGVLNELLFRVASVTLHLRGLWRFGTSLFAAFRRT